MIHKPPLPGVELVTINSSLFPPIERTCATLCVELLKIVCDVPPVIGTAVIVLGEGQPPARHPPALMKSCDPSGALSKSLNVPCATMGRLLKSWFGPLAVSSR